MAVPFPGIVGEEHDPHQEKTGNEKPQRFQNKGVSAQSHRNDELSGYVLPAETQLLLLHPFPALLNQRNQRKDKEKNGSEEAPESRPWSLHASDPEFEA